MLNEFLKPVSEELQEFSASLDEFSLGRNINFDNEITSKSLVIFSVKETRGGEAEFNSNLEFDAFRKEFYQLKKGDWHLPIYDLGDLNPGATKEDTYFALQKIQEEILRSKSVVIVLGGTSNLAFCQYRAFDSVKLNVNLTCVDNRIRLGNDKEDLSYSNYLSKIIAEPPHNLFEYSHLGHQTYFVAQEELDLMEHLNFDVKRLGKLIENISESEPELRSSDMVVLNLESIQSSDFQSGIKLSPNGFNAREICSLSRYTGINNKVQSFGVYNYKAKNRASDNLLLAQIIWYFIEGKNHSTTDVDVRFSNNFEKFYVQIPEQDLTFYHNIQTDQWWLEIKEMNDAEEEGSQVIACSQKDYENSLEGKIPERWWKSYKKLY